MEKIEKYQSELGEKAIKIVLERWYALKLKKVSEQKNLKTPDYEITDAAGVVVAACEVKSCVDANVPVYNPDVSIEELSEISKKRDRNHRSKLQRHHAKAISQLKAYRTLPTLIIFVSFDMTDHIDMDIILQEYELLHPLAPMADLYLLLKIYQHVIPSDQFVIEDTPQLRYSTELGESLGRKYLSLEEALRNNGMLPATFRLEKQSRED
jgi:hypothetical protein